MDVKTSHPQTSQFTFISQVHMEYFSRTQKMQSHKTIVNRHIKIEIILAFSWSQCYKTRAQLQKRKSKKT